MINLALSNLSIDYTWINKKKSYKNNKFKISVPIWNDKFDLLDGSYSVSDIQYFQYITKKYETVTDNPPLRLHVNNRENRFTFKLKRGYYIELLMPETIAFLGRTKNKLTKDEIGQYIPYSEITEVVQVQCNIVKNDYQHDSRKFAYICSQ